MPWKENTELGQRHRLVLAMIRAEVKVMDSLRQQQRELERWRRDYNPGLDRCHVCTRRAIPPIGRSMSSKAEGRLSSAVIATASAELLPGSASACGPSDRLPSTSTSTRCPSGSSSCTPPQSHPTREGAKPPPLTLPISIDHCSKPNLSAIKVPIVSAN